MDLNVPLPLVGLTPLELIPWLWASLPGVIFGAAVTVLLLYLRRYAVSMHVARSAAEIAAEPWYLWPFYVVRRLSAWYLVAIGVVLAVDGSPLGSEVKHAVALGFRLLSIVQGGLLLSAFIKDGVAGYFRSHTKVDGGRRMLIGALSTVATLLVWAIMAMMALNAVGVNVTALVAGLGLGGVAIAFATKNILENVLASFSMVLNPPFVIGDFIKVGEMMGTVEEITLKNVKISALSGEQLIVPSSDLMNSRIANYSRMKERRVVIGFGLGYASMTPARVEEIPLILRRAIERHGDDVRFDRAHVSGFGDNLINFEAVFMVTKPDYNLYMDIQQDVLMAVYREVEKMGASMALGFRIGAWSDLQALQDSERAQGAGYPPTMKRPVTAPGKKKAAPAKAAPRRKSR